MPGHATAGLARRGVDVRPMTGVLSGACGLAPHTFRERSYAAQALRASGLIAVLGGRCAEGRPIVATKRKTVVKRLDLEAMTNQEVLAELARMYGDILDRLNAHLEMGTGDDGEQEPIPDAIDEGVLLHTRVNALTGDFMYGSGGRSRGVLRSREGIYWNWGLSRFKEKLNDASADIAAEAVAS